MKRFRLLTADEIECRIATVKQNGLTLLLYKDARCDMNILDETVGEMNWQKVYSRENRNCTVSLWDSEKSQWISKEDTGTESFTEAEKGLASDSFKRACFNWGIGRELYSAPFVWIPADKCKIFEDKGKYKSFTRFGVMTIEYDSAERISGLVIVNKDTGEVVYTFGKKTPGKRQETPQIGKSVEELPTKAIGVTKAKALKKVLDDRGVAVEFITSLYEVETLADLAETQHKHIHDNIDKLVVLYTKQRGNA